MGDLQEEMDPRTATAGYLILLAVHAICDRRRRIDPIGTGWLKDSPSRERKRRGRRLKSAAVVKLN